MLKQHSNIYILVDFNLCINIIMVKDTFYLYKSDKPDKKFKMVMGEPYNHQHYFGQAGASDFTIHKDEERAKRYRARHAKDNIKSVHSSGAMSWYILWSAKTLSQGIKNYEKAFNVKVIYKK